ncbi:MAG: CrcB family protein [Akkermansiaceae bacterium]|nr:CrcB family protein [Akkermansiaceae bacterium]
MKAFLLVALGGALGALSRWGVAGLVDRLLAAGGGGTARFPGGILAANVIGCFVIGLLYGLAETRAWLTEAARWLTFVGFLGSFTTFSTFGWNTFDLFRHGHPGLALANIAASLLLGLGAVWGGYVLGR